ncbi:MAG: nitroreductase family protein [Myxococcota bacterium]|nr:nitroreductase family protein [Myxococcota bacterium]
MDVFEAIKTRKSVRRYLEKPVEQEKIDQIFEAARIAPSASNRQEWRFVIVKDRDMRSSIAAAAFNQKFVAKAPVVIVACADTDNHVMACGQLSYPIDVSIALDHISLTAVALGLGTCWIGAFDEAVVKSLLRIPNKIRVVELMTLGYPTDPLPGVKSRLPLDAIVKYETW